MFQLIIFLMIGRKTTKTNEMFYVLFQLQIQEGKWQKLQIVHLDG